MQLLGLVRPVGIHFDEKIEVSFESPGESGDVRRSETSFGCAVHDVNVIICGRQRVSDGSGPVGRIVVGDQDVRGDAARMRAVPAVTRSLYVGTIQAPEIIRYVGGLGHSPSVTRPQDTQTSPERATPPRNALRPRGTALQRGAASTHIDTEAYADEKCGTGSNFRHDAEHGCGRPTGTERHFGHQVPGLTFAELLLHRPIGRNESANAGGGGDEYGSSGIECPQPLDIPLLDWLVP